MSKTDYKGIDYGGGMVNVDGSTGIRFGVIQHDKVGQAWWDESEANYHDPECPGCGGKCIEYDEDEHERYKDSPRLSTWGGHADYVCEDCELIFDQGEVCPEEPYSFSYDKDGYACEQGYDDPDIFILKSPFYTWCQYCSPCAPGAGYITNHMEPGEGIKAYCFDKSWFEDEKAPYPVYRVEDDSLVEV